MARARYGFVLSLVIVDTQVHDYFFLFKHQEFKYFLDAKSFYPSLGWSEEATDIHIPKGYPHGCCCILFQIECHTTGQESVNHPEVAEASTQVASHMQEVTYAHVYASSSSFKARAVVLKSIICGSPWHGL